MLHRTLVFFFLLNGYIESQRLVGTHIIYRHGERAPSYQYPTNPNDPFFWPNGLGQLTVRGQLQQLHLGQYFRERYATLLNSTYVASEITIRSSDYDRTLMSAYSNLVGLYPSSRDAKWIQNLSSSNIWPQSLPWQPIPVHTVPRSIDHLMAISECARYDELVEELRTGARIRSLNDEFRDLIQYLEKHANANQSIADIFIAWDIADTVLIEDIYNVTPAWVTPTILRQLRQLSDLAFYHLYYSSEMNRLRGGPLLSDILQNVQNLIDKKPSGRKAKLYSGHDTSIVAVLSVLGVNYVHQPSFASALFFDLYQQDDNSYAIRIEYLNSINGQTAHPIHLPGCPSVMCPIETFNQLYQNKVPEDIEMECHGIGIKRTLPRIIHRV